MIPSGGVCGCVRLAGVTGCGNPPVPEPSLSLNRDTLRSQPLCGGKPPGSVLVPFSISACGFFLFLHMPKELRYNKIFFFFIGKCLASADSMQSH